MIYTYIDFLVSASRMQDSGQARLDSGWFPARIRPAPGPIRPESGSDAWTPPSIRTGRPSSARLVLRSPR